MEFTFEKCKKKRRKHVNFYDDSIHACSDSSLSSNSESRLRLLGLLPKKSHRRKNSTERNDQKRDYLARLFQRKGLKEKSLSKRMKTPFDRKINRTCWPIELGKISKIKKKPHEKRKKKPTRRSLRRRKFSDPTYTSRTMARREKSLSTSCSELCLDDELFSAMGGKKKKNCYFYKSVTPRMLMDVLQDSEYSKSGATLDTIVERLRTMEPDLNDLLRNEAQQKLDCAVRIGLVKEKNGYYIIADHFRRNKLSRKNCKNFRSWTTRK